MKNYKVKKPLVLKSGLVGLTKAQAELRSMQIEPTKKKGIFNILTECHLKTGETVKLDNPPLFLLQVHLIDPSEKKNKKSNSKKDEAIEEVIEDDETEEAEEAIEDLADTLADAAEGE